MSISLYNLTGQFVELLNLADTAGDEAEQQAYIDTLEALEGEIGQKLESCAAVFRSIKAEADAVADEANRLSVRSKSLAGSADRLKSYMQKCMEDAGMERLKTPMFTLAIQKNPDRVVLNVDDPKELPPRFQRVKVEAELSAIKDALKAGDADAAKLAHLEFSRSLRIK